MKNRILALITIMVFCFMAPSFAGYPVKHSANTENATTINTLNEPAKVKEPGKAEQMAEHLARKLNLPESMTPSRHRHTGALGTMSLVFGIVGVVSCLFVGYGTVLGFLFSLSAIILGAIGLGAHEDYSIAGLILGIVGLVIAIATLVLILLFLSILA